MGFRLKINLKHQGGGEKGFAFTPPPSPLPLKNDLKLKKIQTVFLFTFKEVEGSYFRGEGGQ